MLLGIVNIFSQTTFTQTIRGNVVNSQTDESLVGATVCLIKNYTDASYTTTDTEGNFEFKNISVGRYLLRITYVGYNPIVKNNLLLNSGKELFLQLKMEESVASFSEVVVKPNAHKEKSKNEFASVSARSFTVEETERYAGSLGDPSRMAANYAGVVGTNDSRNDIIIRGNSPTGLLWRLEGVDIPSPNHFATDGATGGPVSMINNNLLANSDFFTGAFPAEYGNAMSGVFDLQLRNGNNRKYEFLGQIGFSGFELGAEGPFSKKSNASFIVNYRYSTLAIFDLLGLKFDFGTGGAIPKYQDLNFKINIPTKRFGKFEIFGLGGISSIDFIESDRDTAISTTVAENINLYNNSSTGIIGFKHTYYLPNSSKIITKLSMTATSRGTQIDSLERNNKVEEWRWYASNTSQFNYMTELKYKQKINVKNFWQVGVKGKISQFNYIDSVYRDDRYVHRFDEKGNYKLAEFYSSWLHKFSDNFKINGGLFALYFPLNQQWSIEPRLSTEFQINSHHSISGGVGMHSQTQIPLFYFYRDIDSEQQNFKNLGFNRAVHYVLGYDYLINSDFRVKVETYFQELYNIPVSENETPQFSMINTGDDFYVGVTEDLINKGKGRNYGIEFTVEKFLSNNYYFLVTASLFDSKYRGTDNIWRNTKFNGQYVFNVLGGYEFVFSPKSSLLIDLKGVIAGGKWETPIDELSSIENNEVVYNWERAYTEQLPYYFKINARISYRVNSKGFSQEWAVDLQNLTNHKNIYSQSWNTKKQKLETKYQQGFTPMMTYRILF